jgi:UDP-N-acetylglucosamine 2-epimerase
LVHSKCLIGNSSVGIRECAFLGVPVVNIGTRQNRRLRGENVIDVAYNENEIKAAIKTQLDQPKNKKSNVYGDGKSGQRIAEILATVELRYHKTITY